MKKIIPICLFLTIAFTSQAQVKKAAVCDCPKPNRADFAILCNEVYERKPSSEESELAYRYQQELWRMSCAIEGIDNMETAKKKYNACGIKTNYPLVATIQVLLFRKEISPSLASKQTFPTS